MLEDLLFRLFAWFLIPKKKQTPLGEKRLKTIIKKTALGAGYYIALSDLDIRGAGSLFGYKQSGDGGVGFELYTKFIEKDHEKRGLSRLSGRHL